jgi:hypothetical protein
MMLTRRMDNNITKLCTHWLPKVYCDMTQLDKYEPCMGIATYPVVCAQHIQRLDHVSPTVSVTTCHYCNN